MLHVQPVKTGAWFHQLQHTVRSVQRDVQRDVQKGLIYFFLQLLSALSLEQMQRVLRRVIVPWLIYYHQSTLSGLY